MVTVRRWFPIHSDASFFRKFHLSDAIASLSKKRYQSEYYSRASHPRVNSARPPLRKPEGISEGYQRLGLALDSPNLMRVRKARCATFDGVS